MNKIGFGSWLAATAIVAFSAPAMALNQPTGSTAETQASWGYGCDSLIVSSTKDISNVVYRVDGVDIKIEFGDGVTSLMLPASATDVWIKSGSYRSGDGSGYGMHHVRPQTCETATQADFFDTIYL